MKVKSIITVDVPTANNRIYTMSDLYKMVEFIQPDVLQNRCFMWFGNIHPNEMTLDNIVGIVKNVEIVDGQACFDIDLLDKPNKELISQLVTENKLLVDFYLEAKTFVADENGYSHVDLSEMTINGLSLKLVENCVQVEECV